MVANGNYADVDCVAQALRTVAEQIAADTEPGYQSK